MTPIAVMGLVIEAIQNMESWRMGRFAPMSAKPNASNPRMPFGLTTKVTAPAISLLS